MPDLEVETTVWCPVCHVDKFEVLRKPTEREGVCEHFLKWLPGNGGERDHLVCAACGTNLERKNGRQA